LKKFKRAIACILALTLLFSVPSTVKAQQQISNPVYVVQEGDTLNLIAVRFGISTNDLIRANNIANPNLLAAGTELIIPGLEGVSGKLVTQIVPLGQNLVDISRQNQIPMTMLNRLNRITSPLEVFAGISLIIPQDDQRQLLMGKTALDSQQSLFELAILQNTTPWQLMQNNQLQHEWEALPGELLYRPGSNDQQNPLSPLVADLQVSPLPLTQGGTTVVRLKTLQPVNVSASLAGLTLQFFQIAPNEYVALQGIHAMATPGLSALVLKASSADGQQNFEIDQPLLLKAGNYGQDPTLQVDPKTIDPANTKPEEDLVANTVKTASPTRLWEGKFRVPVDEPICIKSWYGNRRSYNNGPYTYFHTGVDYGVCANLNVYAAAPGVVVYAGPLTVRGNATIIDHGWGVYSGYWHQKDILVKVNDRVTAGQLIGQIGGTGRANGPHLHWEIWVNGIQVQPINWLDNAYP